MARSDSGTCSSADEHRLRTALERARFDYDHADTGSRETAKLQFLATLGAFTRAVLNSDTVETLVAQARRAQAGD